MPKEGMTNNSESEGRVESNPRRTSGPHDEELASAGNLESLSLSGESCTPRGVTQGAERSKWAKRKRPWEANGGWRRNVRKAMCVKQGDPGGGHESRPEVRAAIVAVKRRSGRGAKGRRKVDARRP